MGSFYSESDEYEANELGPQHPAKLDSEKTLWPVVTQGNDKYDGFSKVESIYRAILLKHNNDVFQNVNGVNSGQYIMNAVTEITYEHYKIEVTGEIRLTIKGGTLKIKNNEELLFWKQRSLIQMMK